MSVVLMGLTWNEVFEFGHSWRQRPSTAVAIEGVALRIAKPSGRSQRKRKKNETKKARESPRACHACTVSHLSNGQTEANDFETIIAIPQDAIADRSALTAALTQKARATAALFDQVADLIVQFGGTPAGRDFIASYRASSQIIDRGRSPILPDPEPTPAPTPPVV